MAEEYKGNSNKQKNEAANTEKRVDKVVTGSVKSVKKTDARKFADVFLPEDVSNVKSYFLMNVLVPTLKKGLSELVKSGIDIILYGEIIKSDRRGPSERISYGSYYDHDRSSSRTTKRTELYDCNEFIIDTREEADEVLASMDDLVSRYGLVRVADFYDLVGVTCNYTDNRYGWTDIRSAKIVRSKDGYSIKLPRAMPIDG